jgi:uncharacterized protein YjbJ (UPF0337 family)
MSAILLAWISQEYPMSANKDQVEGRIRVVKGKYNEVAGKVTGDKKLEVKGKVQQIGGKAQEKLGDVKKRLKDSLMQGS